MEKTQELAPSQRNALVEMIGNNYNGLQEKGSNQYRRLRAILLQSFIKEEAEKKGWSNLIADVNQLRTKARMAESALAKVGFVVDEDGDIDFDDDVSSLLRKPLEKRVDKELGTETEFLKPFELAKVKVLTAATAAEAEKLLEDLLKSVK